MDYNLIWSSIFVNVGTAVSINIPQEFAHFLIILIYAKSISLHQLLVADQFSK